MFNKPTVILLGAGASKHHGYPLGHELINDVKNRAIELSNSLKSFNKKFGRNLTNEQFLPQYITDKNNGEPNYDYCLSKSIEECDNLIRRIEETAPLVIDHFLNFNPDLQEIGKILITLVLHEAEAKEEKHLHENWIRYISHYLMLGIESSEQFLENKLTVITFNYDTSLERKLKNSLLSNSFLDSDTINTFFQSNNIIHVYGQLKKTELNLKVEYTHPEVERMKKWKEKLDPAFQASQGIQTIAPSEKIDNKKTLKEASLKLKDAENIYILGYAFDEQNNENIGINQALTSKFLRKKFNNGKGKITRVYFTNYNDMNIISKRASNLFFRRPDKFLNPKTYIINETEYGYYFEMSTKKVLGALEEDFDFTEGGVK